MKHRGTTVADHPFVDLNGKPGDYQDDLKVYGREGEPCRRCRAPVAKARFANKPVYYCEAARSEVPDRGPPRPLGSTSGCSSRRSR